MKPFVVVVIACGLLLAGCASENASDLPEGAVDGHVVGSTCDEATVSDTIGHIIAESNMTVQRIDSLQCVGEWAYATTTITGEDGVSFPDRYLFERSEDAWILKAPETACGTPGTTRPADAQVPEELWATACVTN